MPIVTIQLTREGSSPGADLVTAEEKARLIKGVSELLRDALGKPTKASFVVIDEVPLETWGWGRPAGRAVSCATTRSRLIDPHGRHPPAVDRDASPVRNSARRHRSVRLVAGRGGR